MQDRFRYRAWDKENKKYIYGVENGLQFYSTAGNLRVMTLAEIAESDKYELEQCTGLRNKDEKLIYEGDTLSSEDEVFCERYKVEFRQEYSQFLLRGINTTGGAFGIIKPNTLKVIGNIHETPELLEE